MKRELALELFEEDETEEQRVRLSALKELLQVRGIDAGLLTDRVMRHEQAEVARTVDFNTRIETPPLPQPAGDGVFTPVRQPEQYRVHTEGTNTPRSMYSDQSAEVAKLTAKMQAMEIEMAVEKAARDTVTSPSIAEIMQSQAELLKSALSRDSSKRYAGFDHQSGTEGLLAEAGR